MARKKAAAAAEPTDTQVTDTPEAETPATTMVADVTEPQTHAERVKRQPGYTEQGITDYEAGVRIHEYHNADTRQYLSIIKFEERPSKDVTKLLRDKGFDFSRENEEWFRPIPYETRQQARIDADRVFKEACEMVRAEKGLGESQSVA